MTDEDDILDDVRQSTADGSWPEAEAEALMKKRLKLTKAEHAFSQPKFEKKFSGHRRLDIGAGQIREAGWIAVDLDANSCPDLVMDAHALQMENECVHEIRMIFSLSAFSYPARVLKEAWRVLVPRGELTIVEHAPFSDSSAQPGVRNHFAPSFWNTVTSARPADFIPAGECGRWEMVGVANDMHYMTEKLCQKLKLTREQVIEFFSVVKKQTVKLRKIRT